MKSIACREHGGTFQIESRRGRPPVRCTDENPCTANPIIRVKTATGGKRIKAKAVPRSPEARLAQARAENPRPVRTREQVVDAGVAESATPVKRTRKPAVQPAEVVTTVNPSVPLAHAARKRLEPLGWHCKGVATGTQARVTATRGDELLILVWVDGVVKAQEYVLWNQNKHTANGMPAHSLKFDPDELTDAELVRNISGMRVTWWNALAGTEEHAIVSPDKVQIEHAYSGSGEETPGSRVVKFVAIDQGFRAFRASALLKVGR